MNLIMWFWKTESLWCGFGKQKV